MKTELQKLTEQTLEKEKQRRKEPFCVVIQLPSQPHHIRITYTNPINGKIMKIEEIDNKDNIITMATVKGKQIKGNISPLMRQLIPIFRIKPGDWEKHNKELFREHYYQQH